MTDLKLLSRYSFALQEQLANPELNGGEKHCHIRRRRRAFMMLEATIQVVNWLNKDTRNQAKFQHPIRGA